MPLSGSNGPNGPAEKTPRCPVCKYAGGLVHEAKAALNPARPGDRSPALQPPQPGEATLCFVCGALLEFDQRLELTPITPAIERQLIQLVPGIKVAQAEIRARFRERLT